MRTSFKNEKLTSRSIQALKPRDKRYTIAVDKGLALRVQPSGTKSWVLRIPTNGRVIDITLGHFPDLGLQQAKAEARKRQKSFDIDPIKSYTLNDAFALWCASKKGRIVSYERERRTIQHHLIQNQNRLMHYRRVSVCIEPANLADVVLELPRRVADHLGGLCNSHSSVVQT